MKPAQWKSHQTFLMLKLNATADFGSKPDVGSKEKPLYIKNWPSVQKGFYSMNNVQVR